MPRAARPLRFEILAFVLALFAAGAVFAQVTVRVGALADAGAVAPAQRLAPLLEQVGLMAGVRLEFVAVADNAALLAGVADRRIDLAWVDALRYLQLAERTAGAVLPFVQREEDQHFRSIFIARRDAGIARLEDFAGKAFAFGARTSATAHLMPRFYLATAGVAVSPGQTLFAGAHEAVVTHVASGRVAGGALSLGVWRRLDEQGAIDTSVVVPVFETARYHDSLWVIRRDVDPEVAARLRGAFFGLGRGESKHAAALAAQSASFYIEARAEDYREHAKVAREAGLLP